MNKEDMQQENIHDTNMNIVIIRLDYVGVTDLSELLHEFDSNFPAQFESRQEIYSNQLNVNLRAEDLNSISESISLPVNVIKKEKIVRYSELKGAVCKVTLDISQYFLCMTIMCENNYDGLNSYSSFFHKAAQLFKDNIPYFAPKRLGLRKNRGEYFKTFECIKETFESHLFCLDYFYSECELPLTKKYSDTLNNRCHRDLFINLNREVRFAKKEGEDVYATSLDIDAYFQNESTLKTIPFAELLSEANLYEFEIYKSCMTEEYLNKIMQNE
ncbi:MAG: hypothetical protein SNH57_00685 [Rikenellaceae bacterium]